MSRNSPARSDFMLVQRIVCVRNTPQRHYYVHQNSEFRLLLFARKTYKLVREFESVCERT